MKAREVSVETRVHDAIEAATGVTYHHELARHFLAALAREGLAVVPVEPTAAMIEAGDAIEVYDGMSQNFSCGIGREVYRAMLAAETAPAVRKS